MRLLQRRMRSEGVVKKRITENGKELGLDCGANDEEEWNGNGFRRRVQIEDGVSWSEERGKRIRETSIDLFQKRGVGDWLLLERKRGRNGDWE